MLRAPPGPRRRAAALRPGQGVPRVALHADGPRLRLALHEPRPTARRAHGEPARRRRAIFDATLPAATPRDHGGEPRGDARAPAGRARSPSLRPDLLAGVAPLGSSASPFHVHPAKARTWRKSRERHHPDRTLRTRPATAACPLGSPRKARASRGCRRLTRGRLRLRDGGETSTTSATATASNPPITVLDPAFYADVALRRLGRRRRVLHAAAAGAPTTSPALMRLMLAERATLSTAWSAASRACRRRCDRLAHCAAAQHPRRQPPQHRGALRSRQRLLPADARRDDDVLVRAVRAAGHDARRSPGGEARSHLPRARRSARPTTCSRSAPAGAAFAIHAAGRYGCRVTTTTISPAQFELANERVAGAGLADRVTLLLEDYRDLRGRYDKLVSIEMIEAIGHQQYGEYFRQAAAPVAARRAHGAAGDHHRGPASTNARATRSTSSSATSSRAPASRP